MSTSNNIPGPRSRALAKRLRRVESRNITYVSPRFPIFWESAQGAWIRDVDGNRYLDLSSAFGVVSLGHRSTAVQRALLRQSRKLWHGMGDVHPSAVKVELLEELAKIFPGKKAVSILSTSGAEAVESALKTARLFTGKPGVIAFEGAYHGLSYGTLAVTGRPDFKKPFADQIPPWAVQMPFPDALYGISEEVCLKRVEAYLNGRKPGEIAVGSILIEPIQGRGGVRSPAPKFLQGLRRLADQYQLLLIVDEIFTGFGRTGRTFAYEHAGIQPDLVCVGKALANGFPLSACIGSREVMSAWPESDGEAIHTSTFLGNPLGCAMAVASIREMKRLKLAQRSKQVGRRWIQSLRKKLANHPNVADLRGHGLMIGIELVKDRQSLAPDAALTSRVILRALQKGLIVLSGGVHRNVLTLTPPLTIREQDLLVATRILNEVLS